MHSGQTAFLFPGQGSYDGAALALAGRRYLRVGTVFAEIDEVAVDRYSRRLTDLLFGSTPPDLARLAEEDPWVSQLAIYGAGVAAHRVLVEHGVQPDVLAGHSLGEIAALTAAGYFTIADGAGIVCDRIDTISALGLEHGGMIVLSTDFTRARLLIELLADEQLAVAVHNHERQTVLSGPRTGLDRVLGVAGQLPVAAAELATPFPFHSPMLQPAVERFAELVAAVPQGAADLPVYSPILGEYYEPGHALAEQLASHLVRPVYFADAVQRLGAAGVTRFVEVGGLDTLTQLLPRILPEVSLSSWTTLNLDESGDLGLDRAIAELPGSGVVDAETVARLGAALAPELSREEFADYWATAGPALVVTMRAGIAEYTSTLARQRPTAPVLAPVADLEPDQSPDLDRATLARELRSLYAAALEYPEEVLTDDVRLEAELGVDSVKQVELLTRAAERYGLPERAVGVRMRGYDTMAKIVDFVYDGIRESAGQHVSS